MEQHGSTPRDGAPQPVGFAQLAPRLRPLLLLLSSDHAGEVIAAAAAIGRALRAAGLDWHGLVDALLPASVKPPEPAAATDLWGSMTHQEQVAALQAMQMEMLLSCWESDFIASLRLLLARRPTTFSARQVELLNELLHRLHAQRRAAA